jgi:hypothetical protein
MLSALFNTEKITHDTIQSTLENVAEELGCSHKEFFLMIKPTNEEFDMKFYIYKLGEKNPTFIREISLKEILG